MKVYRYLRVFITSFFIFYVGLGAFARIVLGPPGEIFPVFTWYLFCRVPNEVHDYALRILEIDGEKLEPAPYFQDTSQWFQEANSISAYVSIQKLGAAISAGNTERLEELWRLIESVYLGEINGVRYEVVERSFSPIDRWKYGTFKSIRSLGIFESSWEEK